MFFADDSQCFVIFEDGLEDVAGSHFDGVIVVIEFESYTVHGLFSYRSGSLSVEFVGVCLGNVERSPRNSRAVFASITLNFRRSPPPRPPLQAATRSVTPRAQVSVRDGVLCPRLPRPAAFPTPDADHPA